MEYRVFWDYDDGFNVKHGYTTCWSYDDADREAMSKRAYGYTNARVKCMESDY